MILFLAEYLDIQTALAIGQDVSKELPLSRDMVELLEQSF
jgi:hypothetical protein